MKQKYKLLFFIGFIAFVACTDFHENQSTSISGEIVNPQSPYLTILKNDKTLDTVFLDDHNRFYYQFDKVKDGLYTFSHPIENHYETQMFYIEKGDSLRFRLNTREFDKSLMYSGEGSGANNFLMTLFLDFRENNKILPHYYQMLPGEFKAKADSIKEVHLKELNKQSLDYNFPDRFNKLAKNIIDYAYCDFHERYYFLVNKYNQKLKNKLPSSFLSYRKAVDFNNPNLQSYYIYQYFLDDYLKNQSIEDCLEKSNNWDCFDLKTNANLKKRLTLSDSLFKLESLRTRFLTQFSARLIVDSQTDEAVDSIMDFLEGVKFNKKRLSQIKELSEVQKRQFIGNIGQLHLLLPSGKTVKISSLLDEPTVFYYWSVYYSAHHEKLHKKINTLRERYPQLNFVGVNINTGDLEFWKNTLKSFDYDQKTEYQLICPPQQQDLYRNYLNKLLFVDTTGRIVAGDLSLNDRQLEEEILGLLNR